MLSAAQQAVAVLRVGETLQPPGLLAATVPSLAAQYDGLDATLPDYLAGVSLEDLYVRRGLAEVALGACRAAVDQQTADQKDFFSQESARLLALLRFLTDEIQSVGDMARSSGDIAVGLLTTVEPIAPLYPAAINANDPIFKGTPYPRRVRLPNYS